MNEPPRGKLRGIKPCRFRIALKVNRVIRVICGLNFGIFGRRRHHWIPYRDVYLQESNSLFAKCKKLFDNQIFVTIMSEKQLYLFYYSTNQQYLEGKQYEKNKD
jgi:hypothetical protein